jgi:hypothetical protein
MENKKIDYCDECVKELDEFSKGIRDSRSNYLGEKNNCAIQVLKFIIRVLKFTTQMV